VSRFLKRLPVGVLAVLLAACSAGMQPPAAGAGAPVPASAVERFLQLAEEGEYLQMGWYFGTSEGPILDRDEPSEVEKRMYALATVLQNDGFVVGPPTAVPGRIGSAQGFTVRLQRQGRTLEVPFVTVRGSGDRWLVESVDLQVITNQPL
jgi:hypothetical protein